MVYAMIAVLGLAPAAIVVAARPPGWIRPWRFVIAAVFVIATGIGEWFVHDLRTLPDWSHTDFNGVFVVH